MSSTDEPFVAPEEGGEPSLISHDVHQESFEPTASADSVHADSSPRISVDEIGLSDQSHPSQSSDYEKRNTKSD